LTDEIMVEIPEGFHVVSIPLDIPAEDLAAFRRAVREVYDSEVGIPAADSALILRLEVLESRPGTRYDDICISEIFFNDRLVSPRPLSVPSIESVYVSEDEHALLMDTPDEKEMTVYRDGDSVLQLMETSENGKWAILIAMPAEIEGRAETTYLLVNCYNREVVNAQLESITGDYLAGNEMYFETGEDGSVRQFCPVGLFHCHHPPIDFRLRYLVYQGKPQSLQGFMAVGLGIAYLSDPVPLFQKDIRCRPAV